MRWLLRSKIHNATVTEAEVDYEGSIGIDGDLVQKSGLMPGERVLVVDSTSGARVETYVILEDARSGRVVVNGAAALLIGAGDKVIIMGFELADAPIEARKVLVDEGNRFVRYL